MISESYERSVFTTEPVYKLYRRWESQPWQALSIDLRTDRDTWLRLPTALRSELRVTISELGGGDLAVTHLLVPLIVNAPREAWRLYLTTQLSDESKHALFFRRYYREVVCANDDAPPPDFAAFDDSAYRRDFEPLLTETVNAIPAAPDYAERWYQASALYHLVTEGVLGMTVLGVGRLLTGRRGLLPGLSEGLVGVLRDESRHIGFGRRAARVGVADGHGAQIAETYVTGTAMAARVLVGPEREEPRLTSPMWRNQRSVAKRARLNEAYERATRQAERLALPVSRGEIEQAWMESWRAAVRDYGHRWKTRHSLAESDGDLAQRERLPHG